MVLTSRIEDGELSPGGRLPAETELARDFGVNRLTVRQAIGELARLGQVRVQHGVGTFVAPAQPRVDVVVAPLTVDAAQVQALAAFHQQGWTVEEGLLGSEAVADDPLARTELARPHGLLRRVRTRTTVNDTPWILSSYWFADDELPGLAEALEGSGEVFPVVQRVYGLQLRYDWRSFAAAAATAEDAGQLDVPVGSPLLVREGLNRDQHGRAISYVHRRVRPDRARFVLRYSDG